MKKKEVQKLNREEKTVKEKTAKEDEIQEIEKEKMGANELPHIRAARYLNELFMNFTSPLNTGAELPGIHLLKAIVPLVLLSVGLFFSSGTNDAEKYSVVQKWPSGNLSVVTQAGLYWAGPFSKVTEFKRSSVVKFSQGISGEETIDESIFVRFKDNGTARIRGVVKYLLPANSEKIRMIKNELGNDEVISKKVLRNYINQVLIKTASKYTSSESIRNRAGFFNDINESLISGKGPTGRYSIEILSFTLNKIIYDQQSQAKFDEQRLLEQQKNNAKIQAEKSQQDAITAKAEGEKLIAQTKAREENLKLEAAIQANKAAEIARIKADEEKMVAITAAKKEFDVEKLELEKAKLEKEVMLLRAEGKRGAALKEAEGRKALAEADNSLELRLKTQKEMMIGMAQALKDIKVPTAIIGTSGNSSGNPILDLFLMNQIKSLTDVNTPEQSGE